MPVSGGGFAPQLGVLRMLIQAGYKPHLAMGASGGNCAVYTAMASGWNDSKLDTIAADINTSMFISPWGYSLPSVAVGFFKGSVYDHSYGIRKLFNAYFTPSTIKNIEVWTTTYNRETRKTCLFTNVNSDETLIPPNSINIEISQSAPPIYADGNIDLISDFTTASASIPAVVPPVNIHDSCHVDGGVSYASPLSVLQDSLTKLNDGYFHLVYISPFNININTRCNNDSKCNMVDVGIIALDETLQSKLVIDRMTAYGLLRCFGEVKYREGPLDIDTLSQILTERRCSPRSLLEIYPSDRCEVDLYKFNGEDVLNSMDRSYQSLQYRFWWCV